MLNLDADAVGFRRRYFLSIFSDIFAAVSLANISFLRVWRELLFASSADQYFLPDYSDAAYLAIIVNISLCSVLLWAVIKFMVRSRYRWRQIVGSLVVIGFMIFPANLLRMILSPYLKTIDFSMDYRVVFVLLGVVLLVVGLYFLFFQAIRVAHTIIFMCLVLSPFAVLNLGQAVWIILSKQPASVKVGQVSQSPLRTKKPIRIVLLIMDELDLGLTYLERSKDLKLPEFDRLRRQALFASNTNGYSTNTMEAIPSFLLQKIVRKARPIGPRDLHLTFDDVESAKDGNFLQLPNFFSEATQFGARAAIIGYYHPYCRLFAAYTAHCESHSFNTHSPRASNDIAQEMLKQVIGITPLAVRINGALIYSDMEKAIVRYASDPQFDLVYLHASVPHGPFIWDDKNKSFTLTGRSKDGYFNNLRLADRLLGKIRRAMEMRGIWDESAVLLTSDHGWRIAHLHGYPGARRMIPFVLKMPGQRHAIDFAGEFAPMRLTKDLLLHIQRGAITNVIDAAEWIEKRQPSAR